MTDSQPNIVRDELKDLPQITHRRLIGFLGLLLPVLLYVIAGMGTADDFPGWDPLRTVSAYYYTGSVGMFIGVLFALSLFLLTYPGYRRGTKNVLADRLLGWLGCLAALGVALFPTEAPPGQAEPPWWRSWMQDVHYVSAVLIFSAFILFSIWLFRKSNIPNRRDRPTDKRRRDAICLICGIVMIACVL